MLQKLIMMHWSMSYVASNRGKRTKCLSILDFAKYVQWVKEKWGVNEITRVWLHKMGFMKERTLQAPSDDINR